jgi:hypothetical protein
MTGCWTLKHLRDQGNTSSWWNMTRTRSDRRLRGRHRPRRRRPWRPDRRPGHARRDHGRPRLDHRQYLSGEPARSPVPGRSGARARAALKVVRRTRQQPQERHGRLPARQVHLRHRRLGRRQVHLTIETLYKAAREAERRAQTPAPCRRSRGSNISTRSSTSTSRRSAARRAPTRPPTPAPSRRSATGSRACRRPRRAATSPAGSPSTSRAGAARPARATASSRSRCTSCPTSTSPATTCKGKRYNRETLEVSSRASPSPTCST